MPRLTTFASIQVHREVRKFLEHRLGRQVGLTLAALVGMAGMALARPVTVRGIVRRADNQTPIQGATVEIKVSGLADAPVLQSIMTDESGAFQTTVSLDVGTFLCEASATGMMTQRVRRPINASICDFELESKLILKDITPRSAEIGRGAGLSFLVHTDTDVLLSKLTVRLHLPQMECPFRGGDIQKYDLDGTVNVDFTAARGTIHADGEIFEMSGDVILGDCALVDMDSEVSLQVQPARLLHRGDTQIVVTLPSVVTFRLASRKMIFFKNEERYLYRRKYKNMLRVVSYIIVELATSRDSLASAVLPNLAIPVVITW